MAMMTACLMLSAGLLASLPLARSLSLALLPLRLSRPWV
jgi:hypothetical protein